MIVHITTKEDWKRAQSNRKYIASSLDNEGFIHCSTVRQAVDTANLFFKGQKELILLCIDENRLKTELKYEDPTSGKKHDTNVGKLFPHVYGPINLDAVKKVVEFPSNEYGYFTLPIELEKEL